MTDAIERAGGRHGRRRATRSTSPPPCRRPTNNLPARSQAPVGVPGAAGLWADDGPISLGTATVEQLDTIEGIGPVTAAAILEFRDERGGVVVGRRARRDQRHRTRHDGGPAGAPAAVTAELGFAWRFAALAGLAARTRRSRPPRRRRAGRAGAAPRPGRLPARRPPPRSGACPMAGAGRRRAPPRRRDSRCRADRRDRCAARSRPADGERVACAGIVVIDPARRERGHPVRARRRGTRIAVESRRRRPMSTRAAWWSSTGRLAHRRPGRLGPRARRRRHGLSAGGYRARAAGVRGGLRGALDGVRRRAEAALERGTSRGLSGAPARLRARPGRPDPRAACATSSGVPAWRTCSPCAART